MGILTDAMRDQNPETNRLFKLVAEGDTDELYKMWQAAKDTDPSWAHTLQTYHEAAFINELERRSKSADNRLDKRN